MTHPNKVETCKQAHTLDACICTHIYFIIMLWWCFLWLCVRVCQVCQIKNGLFATFPKSGLASDTTYFYKCGDSSLSAMSGERKFRTLPQPSPKNYPSKIAMVGDLGLTYNSTSTFDHIVSNEPSLLLMIGDLSYANQYITTGIKGASCYSCSFPDTPIRETYQPHWDAWGRCITFFHFSIFLKMSLFYF